MFTPESSSATSNRKFQGAQRKHRVYLAKSRILQRLLFIVLAPVAATSRLQITSRHGWTALLPRPRPFALSSPALGDFTTLFCSLPLSYTVHAFCFLEHVQLDFQTHGSYCCGRPRRKSCRAPLGFLGFGVCLCDALYASRLHLD